MDNITDCQGKGDEGYYQVKPRTSYYNPGLEARSSQQNEYYLEAGPDNPPDAFSNYPSLKLDNPYERPN